VNQYSGNGQISCTHTSRHPGQHVVDISCLIKVWRYHLGNTCSCQQWDVFDFFGSINVASLL